MTVELRTPDPETIDVLDFDLVFDNGFPLELVVGPDDAISQEGDVMTVEIRDTGDIYEIALPKLLFTRKRVRTVPKPARQDPPSVASASVPPRAATVSRPAIDSLQVFPVERAD